MAANNLKFSSAIDDWVKATDQRMTAVFRESTQRTVSRAQERIPVDTGFARASVRASTEEMPQIETGFVNKTKTPIPYDGAEITVVIAGAQLGQTIYIGWTASYVGELENGHSKQAPSGFVGLAALEWPQIVNQVTAEAKARV